MAVRTRVLAAGSYAAGGSNKVLFTCPAGRTAIVKDVVLRNADVAARDVHLWTGRTTASVRIFVVTLAAGDSVWKSGLFLVLEPGDILTAFATGTATFTAWVSGTLLQGAPS